MNGKRDLVLIVKGGDLYNDSYSSPTDHISECFQKMGFGTKIVSIYDQIQISDDSANRLALIYSLSPIQISRWKTTSGHHLSELCPFVCHYPNSPFLIDPHIRSAPDSVIFASSSFDYLYQFQHFFKKFNTIINCPAFPTCRAVKPTRTSYLKRSNLFLFVGATSLHGQSPHRSDADLRVHWRDLFKADGDILFECYQTLLASGFSSTVDTLDRRIDIEERRRTDPNSVVRMIRELDIRVRFAKRRALLNELVRFPSLIVGTGWKDLLDREGVGTMTDTEVPYSALPDLYRNSQVALSVAHSTVFGEHERIYLPWLCGSTLASEPNLWLEREFREGVHYAAVPPGGPDCADALADLSRDADKRFEIARAGWARAEGRFLPEHSATYYLRVGTAIFAQQQRQRAAIASLE